MKRIHASLVLMVLLFPALGETMDDLVYRDGLYYKKFTVVPFTGNITGKTEQGAFRNGKKEGPWVYYHSNGQLSYKVTYKDNKKDGPYVNYYDNGQLSSKGTYKDGKEVGPWVRYWSDGSEMVVED